MMSGISTGWMKESGTFELDTGNLTFADILDTGSTPTDTEWVNAIIYVNANNGCTARITNVSMEYLDV